MIDKQQNSGNPITGRDQKPMTNYNQQVFQTQKRTIASLIWMQYFNRTLYDQGLITEEERNRMKVKISARYGDNNYCQQSQIYTVARGNDL